MEYIDDDVKHLLQTLPKRGQDITSQHLKVILYNLLCATKYMHSANIVHRDIKPGNILINQHCEVRICDFGIARSLPQNIVRMDLLGK